MKSENTINFKFCVCSLKSQKQNVFLFFLGLAAHHASVVGGYYVASSSDPPGSSTHGKYQENGHDTFSDFVTLVCQEAQNTQQVRKESKKKE